MSHSTLNCSRRCIPYCVILGTQEVLNLCLLIVRPSRNKERRCPSECRTDTRRRWGRLVSRREHLAAFTRPRCRAPFSPELHPRPPARLPPDRPQSLCGSPPLYLSRSSRSHSLIRLAYVTAASHSPLRRPMLIPREHTVFLSFSLPLLGTQTETQKHSRQAISFFEGRNG